MRRFSNPDYITPKEFEQTVHAWFESFADELNSFDAEHLEKHTGGDGDYEIDVTVRFTAFGGASFLVLCECKKYSNPIERGLVQILNDKRRSLNAQKAMMVSTAPYQSGAKKYAKTNNIALVEVKNGGLAYISACAGPPKDIVPSDADEYCGMIEIDLLLSRSKNGNPAKTTPFPMPITTQNTFHLEEFFKGQ